MRKMEKNGLESRMVYRTSEGKPHCIGYHNGQCVFIVDIQ